MFVGTKLATPRQSFRTLDRWGLGSLKVLLDPRLSFPSSTLTSSRAQGPRGAGRPVTPGPGSMPYEGRQEGTPSTCSEGGG